MKLHFILAIPLFFATVAEAKKAKKTKAEKTSVYGAAGFTDHGLSYGLDYQMKKRKKPAWGGYARIYPKNEDFQVDGVNSFGAFVRPTFKKRKLSMYLSPGFGMMMVDTDVPVVQTTEDGETPEPGETENLKLNVFGPSFAFGAMYHLSKTSQIGIEQMSHYSWFGGIVGGPVVNDFSVKVLISF